MFFVYSASLKKRRPTETTNLRSLSDLSPTSFRPLSGLSPASPTISGLYPALFGILSSRLVSLHFLFLLSDLNVPIKPVFTSCSLLLLDSFWDIKKPLKNCFGFGESDSELFWIWVWLGKVMNHGFFVD